MAEKKAVKNEPSGQDEAASSNPARSAAPSEKIHGVVRPGATVRVYQMLTEKNAKGEEKKRTQIFEGLVLAHKHGREAGATITVRKVTEGIGVEKIFPLNSPWIEKIEVIRQARVRRAKLGYLRSYGKRLKEKTVAS